MGIWADETAIEDGFFSLDSTWKVVPGLTNDEETISLQSAQYPEKFLHIDDMEMAFYAHENDGSDQFLIDATFRVW
jgi:hypothetical protein